MGLVRVKKPGNECRVFYFLSLHTHGVEYIGFYIFNRPDFIKFRTKIFEL